MERATEECDELLLRLLRGEAERARATRVGDPPVRGDEHEPLRPGGERRAHMVVHRVEEKWHAEREALGARERGCPAFGERRLLRENGVLLEVRRHLPLVGRVRLCDIDEREVGSVAEAAEEALDVAGPATKRRSGEAAEDEQQRTASNEIHDCNRLEVVGAAQRHRGQRVAGLEGLRRAVAGEARDHRVALGARFEALDVAAVARIDDGVEGRICGAILHGAKLTDGCWSRAGT